MAANEKQIGGNHYRDKPIQPWDAMEAWMTRAEFVGFLKGNAIKYLARAGSKGPIEEDIQKAMHYLEKLMETLTTTSTLPTYRVTELNYHDLDDLK